VLNNGAENLAGVTGIKTGELHELETFDEFLDAYLRQLRYLVTRCRSGAEERVARHAHGYYDPYASALIDDCVECGRGVFEGGARHTAPWAIGGFGLGTAVDSLSAVKRFVYEQGSVSLAELRDALRDSFAGRPDLQVMLRQQTPSFGNDLDQPDRIATVVFNAYADAVHGLNDGSLPGKYVTMVFSYNRHVYAGEVTAATPDGRDARTSFSDAIGPSQGRDQHGPTAMLNSILKLDMGKMTGAYALNFKISPELLREQSGRQAVKDLFTTYLRAGGVQLQVTCVDGRLLRAAQAHPEQHPNIIVRIAGYSEYFRKLSPDLQNEIIARTEYRCVD
jgi:formate C-acetyltransferase